MRRTVPLAAFAAALVFARAPAAEPAGTSVQLGSSTKAPAVALLVTAPRGEWTNLVLQTPGAPSPAPPAATLHHAEGGSVKGEAIPGTSTVVAVADMVELRDPSWGASLVRLEPGNPPRTLVDRVCTASRPLVTADGRVFVTRGVAGPEPTESDAKQGMLRVDDITIDEVDPATGASRTVHRMSGYLAFLAGAIGGEIVVYRIAPRHADLVAIDATTGTVRVVAPSILPFARDFSVDAAARAMVFTERDARSPGTWVVDRIDLASGAITQLAEGPRMALVAHVWPGGRVVWNPGGDRGLAVLGRGEAGVMRPLGDGVDVVRALSGDGRWAALEHTLPSQLSVPFVLRVETGQPIRLAIPAGMRADVAGFVR